MKKTQPRRSSRRSSRTSPRTSPRKTPRTTARRLSVESLEQRQMMAASVVYSDTTNFLYIYGDDWRNDATVRSSGSKVTVEVVSTPQTGFSLVPERIYKEFTKLVKEVKFYGGAGDDRFVSYLPTTPVYAQGDAGNDYLESYNGNDRLYGGAGNDTIKAFGGDDLVHGGSGNDTIYGGAGNDNLYGDSGDDLIYGEAGLDGLYGGSGTDSLYGGAGADRFLVFAGDNEHKDAAAEDAVIRFDNGSKNWTEEEIEDVDLGLQKLHLKTKNDNLLELKNGSSLTFYRQKASGTSLADNNSAGRINIYDSALTSPERIALTVVHEVAHNWDTEHSNWTNWMKLSGWTDKDPKSSSYVKGGSTSENWWHSKTASFASSYAKTNPREDWAESWQSYFVHKEGMKDPEGLSKLSSAKLQHLDAFFASLS